MLGVGVINVRISSTGSLAVQAFVYNAHVRVSNTQTTLRQDNCKNRPQLRYASMHAMRP